MRTRTKRFSAALCALGLAVTAAACGSSGNGGDGATGGGDASQATCPLSALPKSGAKVKISLWYGGLSGKSKSAMTSMVKAYNASQDRVEVTASDQGAAYTQVLTKYTAAIPNRIPNIVYAESSMAQVLVDSGTIIPGGACADEGVVPLDHIVPVVKAFYTLDGAYVPGAVNVSTPQFYYNKKQFQEAGLPLEAPATLDEVRADAEKLKAAGISGLEWPMSMTVNPWYLETLLGGIGQHMVDNDNGHSGHATKAIFDTPDTVKVMNQLKSMYDDGLVAKVSNTPGQIDQYLNLAQGKSTMLFETSTAATTIEAFLGGKLTAEELEGGDLGQLSQSVTVAPGFGPMPGVEKAGQVPVSGGAYYVSNAGNDPQQAAAMDFIRYVNQIPQQVQWLTEGSYLPSNDQVTEQPEVKKFFEGQIAGLSLRTAAAQLAAVPPENPGPMVGPNDQYIDILQKMMESVFLKDADPAQALAKAEADVTKAIQDYNSSNGF
ncbi:MAG TPA: extracellular solute-binding protein [Acidimicrobiales bacterium]|nr:extracellular solute-binding protein [Acidimicrobiales bacterium]